MDYYSNVGHYLLYPLAVLAMTSFFFFLGLRVGKKWEQAKISQSNEDFKEDE